MPRSMKIIVLIITALFVVPLASISQSSEPDFNGSEIQPNFADDPAQFADEDISQSPDFRATRSLEQASLNFEITSDSPQIMPKVNESWTQNQWDGGSGQDLWVDDTKYKSSSNLVTEDPSGNMVLGIGGSIEAWNYLGKAPFARYQHKIVWSPFVEKFYIFGGYKASFGATDELFEYDPVTDIWKEVGKLNGPSPRVNPGMAWDASSNLLWIYGGYNAVLYNDLWAYNPVTDTWAQKENAPTSRSYQSMVYNPVGRQLICYGGYEGSWYTPSDDMEIYNIQTNTWTVKQPATPRYYHDASWVPKTNSMMVYGGVRSYETGVGYVYQEGLQEYFPNNDTWTNRSSIGYRNRYMMAWDTYNDKLIIHGGTDPAYKNETWYYEVDADTWEKKIDGPHIQDYSDGDWDTVNNQFFTYGGFYQGIMSKYWVYYPNVPSFKDAGEVISSVFTPGYKINPSTLSYGLTKNLSSSAGNYPIKIKLAGSDKTADDVNIFVGPNGLSNSYFSDSSGEAVHSNLHGSKYLAYEVNFSTQNPLISPILDWIKIDYYTYPSEYTYESQVYIMDDYLGLPLRYVTWTDDLPAGTGIEIYFRQSIDSGSISVRDWEQVNLNQKTFGYKIGGYFQYKVHLTTSEPAVTPVLETVKFIFNELPTKPVLTAPENNTWIADSRPEFGWEFNDPDTEDYMTAFEIYISYEETVTALVTPPIEVEGENTSYRITDVLSDGTYYWKVRTRDNYGSWGTVSNVMCINIDTQKPLPPRIECYTHPLEQLWYPLNQPRFDWLEPDDITGIEGYSYVLDQSTDTEPPETIMITTEEYNNKHNLVTFNGFLLQNDVLADGIWYLKMKAVDSLGTWSDTSTREVKIDSSPAEILDLTPSNTGTGGMIQFKFELNDSASGIDLATISWRYPSDIDFRYDELVPDGNGYHIMEHTLEETTDRYIEYYISVTDNTNPVNEVRFPVNGQKRVNILDTIPPEVTSVTGDTVQYLYNNMVITVDAVDNVGPSKATLYINDETEGRRMNSNDNGKFYLEINRNELEELSYYHGDNTMTYYITVEDASGNSVREPTDGSYDVELKELEFNLDDTNNKDDKSKSQTGMSRALIVNIVAMVVVIILVAIVLIIFIRKQSENIYSDRHKLRMAIADAQEATSNGNGAPQLNVTAAPVGTNAQLPAGNSPVIDITATVQSSAAPGTVPQTLDTARPAVAGYLPPASIDGPGKVELDSGHSVSIPGNAGAPQPQGPTPTPAAVPTPVQAATPSASATPSVDLPQTRKDNDSENALIWTPPDAE